jgi:hypothetical protein
MTRRRSVLAGLGLAAVAVAVVVAALVSGGGGGGHKAPVPVERGLEIGLQDNAVFLERRYYDRERAFDQARQLGVSWMRTNLLWSRVEPRPESFDWSQYDSLVDAASRAGIAVQMSLTGPAPGWATGDGRKGVLRPDAAAFGRFASAAATHFRGRVRRYSIWNEPNFVNWLAPLGEQPSLYRRLYQAGFSAVKRADPAAEVLIGETAAYAKRGTAMAPLEFLRRVACRGCPELFADGYAHHPYEFTDPPDAPYPGADNATIGTIGHLTNELDRLAQQQRLATLGGLPLPVYLTEFGYFASGRHAQPAAVRADWIVQAYEIAQGMYPRVRQLLQYLLVTPPPGTPGDEFDTGIVEPSGRAQEPFSALAAWAAREQRLGRLTQAR